MPTFDKNKQYRLKNGFEYRNYCDDGGGDCPIHGAYRKSELHEWKMTCHQEDLTHRFYKDQTLVEISPYENFKKDDPVMVSDSGNNWYKRYFSHVENGTPFAFIDGATSWSKTAGAETWAYCRRPTEEELNGTT